MALFDDRRFLLSHINHSFITGDDTGICEVVMLDEEVFENQHQQCLNLIGQNSDNPESRLEPSAFDLPYESELVESEQGQSYDIASDLDYICHRRRSNTAQRLDRLKKEKMNQSKTTTIVWRCPSPNIIQGTDKSTSSQSQKTSNGVIETKDLFQAQRARSPPTKSGLTRLLEKFPSLPKNPFDEYAQYDGGMSESVPVKKIMIFIALNHNDQQSANEQESDQGDKVNQQTENLKSPNANAYDAKTSSSKSLHDTKSKTDGPLEVVIVSTARVQDLIGLICWQYTNEGREPKLYYDINKYCLRIAEENGEVDPDFTSLNPKEPLSKFNFPHLALTEKTEERARSFDEQYVNGSIYGHCLPTLAPNIIKKTNKSSRVKSKLTAITRIIFRDAKLDANQ